MRQRDEWEFKLGKTFLDKFSEIVLAVGRDMFTRREMIEKLGCANFTAAKRLTWALDRFRPKSVREVAGRITLNDLWAVDGVGITTVYVWTSVLEYSGIDSVNWISSDLNIPSSYKKNKVVKKRRNRFT